MQNISHTTTKSLPVALLRAREHVISPVRSMLAGVGITEQQWRVLRVLDENGSLEPTVIAERTCLLLPSLTRILQKLEEKELIRREQSTTDRRKQVVHITSNGMALIEDHLDVSLSLANELRQNMGPDRYETLIELLNELCKTPSLREEKV